MMHDQRPAFPPLALLLALATVARGQDDAQTGPDAATLFANRCASCHVPPDTTFAVDRAWIAQLADTA